MHHLKLRVTLVVITTMIITAAMAVIACAPAQQQPDQTDLTQTPTVPTSTPDGVAPPIRSLARAHARRVQEGNPFPTDSPRRRHHVVIYFHTVEQRAAARQTLEELGVTRWIAETDPAISDGKVAIGFYVDVSLLHHLDSFEGAWWVRYIPAPQLESPSSRNNNLLTSDDPHGVRSWHYAGITGSNIQLGIIDKGFQGLSTHLTGAMAPTPIALCQPNGTPNPSDPIQHCQHTTDHGTQVYEAIKTIAPDAQIYVATAHNEQSLYEAVQWMTGTDNDDPNGDAPNRPLPWFIPPYQPTSNDDFKIDIINYSVGHNWDGPGDGTSPFTTIDHTSSLISAHSAVRNGTLWVNAAGNRGEQTWYSNSPNFAGKDLVFDTSSADQTCLEADLQAGDDYAFHLRWKGQWPGQNHDLRLQIDGPPDEQGDRPYLDHSDMPQHRGAAYLPQEVLIFDPPTTGSHCLRITQKTTADNPGWIQLVQANPPEAFFSNHGDRSQGGINNPSESANPGLLAVGNSNPANPSVLHPKSARGPAPEPQPNGRIKPDIVAAGSSTSFSTPIVAGMAALIAQALQQSGTRTHPSLLADYIRNMAIQQEEPTNNAREGPTDNNFWGHGFVRLPQPPPPTDVILSIGFGPTSNINVFYKRSEWIAASHDAAHTTYHIVVRDTETQSPVISTHIPTDEERFILSEYFRTPIPRGYQYTAQIRRCTFKQEPSDSSIQYACGDWSPTSEPLDVPLLPPSDIRIFPTDQAITVLWQPTNGASLYQIELPNGDIIETASTKRVITGLNNDEPFQIRMRSARPRNVTPRADVAPLPSKRVVSAWSSYQTTTPNDSRPNIPFANYTSSGTTLVISYLRHTDAPDFQIQQWNGTATEWRNLPFKERGHTIAFEITVSEDGVFNRNGSTATIAGLLPGTSYAHRIRAVNHNLRSEWSHFHTTTIPPENAEDPTITPTPTPPPYKSLPSNLRGFVTSNVVQLDWRPGYNPNYTEQNVLRRVAGESPINWTRFPVALDPSSYTDSSGVAGTTYIYRVEALKANGIGWMTNHQEITYP